MTRPAARAARLLSAAAAVVLAGGALAGCSAHPGQAFVGSYTTLEGRNQPISVSEDDVQTVVSDLAGVQGFTAQDAFQGLVMGPVLEDVARKHGVEVSDDDVRAALEQSIGPGSYSRTTIDAMRLQVLSGVMNEQDEETVKQVRADLETAQGSLSGDVSPRYNLRARGQGQWLVPTGTADAGTGQRGGR